MGLAPFPGSCWLGEEGLQSYGGSYGPWEVLSRHVGSQEARRWPDPGLTGPEIHQFCPLLDTYDFFFCLIFCPDGVALSLAWEGEGRRDLGI